MPLMKLDFRRRGGPVASRSGMRAEQLLEQHA